MSTDLTPPAYQPVVTTLWGVQYETIPQTRSVIAKIDELQTKIIEADGNDESVDLIAERFDLRLKPVVKGSRKASTLVKERWKGEELLLDQLFALVERLDQLDRPT